MYSARPAAWAAASGRGVSCPMNRRSGTVASRRPAAAEVFGGFLDGLDDLDVPRAATEVAGERLGDLGAARRRVGPQERGRGENHPRRAEPALDATALHESALDGRELAC